MPDAYTLATLLQELIDATVPAAIKRPPMDLGIYNQGYTESEFLDKFKCVTHLSACGRIHSVTHSLCWVLDPRKVSEYSCRSCLGTCCNVALPSTSNPRVKAAREMSWTRSMPCMQPGCT